MSIAAAIRIAEDLARIGVEVMDPALDASRVGELLARRDELIWSLRAECIAEELARSDARERERLASLLRGTVAQDDRLRATLDARRHEALMELAATARSASPLTASAEPKFTERVA